MLGLACGREFVLNNALRAAKVTGSVGELGLLEAGRKAGVDRVLVLTTMPHSSLAKAASVVGLGRASVVDVGQKYDPLAFDIEVITRNLKLANTRSIVVVSCGDINTGGFATRNFEEMRKLREICDEYGAWLHVDGGKMLRAILLFQDLIFPSLRYIHSGTQRTGIRSGYWRFRWYGTRRLYSWRRAQASERTI